MDITMAQKETQQYINVFCCYAHEDEAFLNKLKRHLKPLQHRELITVWYDRNISAGTAWKDEIKRHLNEAQIILLLISPDFLDSQYCYGVEMQDALERHKNGKATVIPVILRYCLWHETPLGALQALPTDGRPVTSEVWHNEDQAFYMIVLGIRKAIEALPSPLSPPLHNGLPPTTQSASTSLLLIESDPPVHEPEDRLTAQLEKNAFHLGLLSPDQSEGDAADISFFPNTSAQTFEPSQHSAGKEEPLSDLPNQTQDFEDKGEQESNTLKSIQKEGGQATTVRLHADARYIIGVDIDRSHLTLLLTDQDAHIIQKEEPTSFDINTGAEVYLARLADELQTLLERSSVTWEQVIGVGLATPGPLDRSSRKILSVAQNAAQKKHSASQMPGWEGKDIPNTLEQKLKLKKQIPMYLGKDANMGALGESWYGAGRGIENFVYVKIAIGIGAGLIINGDLYHGSTKAAGELGHVIVKEKGKICPCGKRGCLETVAAEPAIVKDACEGISLHAFLPRSTQTPALARYKGKAGIVAVIDAARDGDEASRLALKHAGEWIGRALGMVIDFFNPSMILLDGDVVRTDFFRDALEHSAQESSLFASWDEVRIRRCTLDRPVAFGAVANVIKSLSKVHRKRKS